MKKIGDFIKWLEGYLDALSQHDDTSIVEVSDTIKTKLDSIKKSIDIDDVALDDFRKIIDKCFDDFLNKKNDREVPKYYTPIQGIPSMVPYHTTCGCSVCSCVMGNRMVPNPYYNSGGCTTTTTTTSDTAKSNLADLLKG